jgi:hypothetical protein
MIVSRLSSVVLSFTLTVSALALQPGSPAPDFKGTDSTGVQQYFVPVSWQVRRSGVG